MSTRAAPLVTIAIPFFDEERHLEGAIRSVLAQTFTDFELLLVDDGSRDRSLEIARSFDDPRISVITDGHRRRLAARLNDITRRARGAIVARMDADDACHPTRLREELAVLDADAAVDAVGTWAGLVDASGELFAVAESPALPADPGIALERGLLVHPTMVARRRWLERNPYDETLSRTEDRDLWCRIAKNSRLAVIERPLYVLRVEEGGSFVADYLTAQRQSRDILRRYGRELIGLRRSVRFWATAHGKALLMRGAAALHLERSLIHRRGRPPTAAERTLVAEAIAASQRA